MSKKIVLLVLLLFPTQMSAQINVTGTDIATKRNNQSINNQSPWPLLQQTVNKLAQINYSNPFIAEPLISEDLLPLFDFEHIARHIVRVVPYRLTDPQIYAIAQVIQGDIASILLAQLTSTNIFGVNIANITPISLNYLKVSLHIRTNNFVPIFLSLVIYNNGVNWRIIDVILNNSSLIQYYQQMVLSKISHRGTTDFF